MKHMLFAQGTAGEELYFHQKDAELLDRLRRGFELEAERQRIGDAIGVSRPKHPSEPAGLRLHTRYSNAIAPRPSRTSSMG